MASVGCSDNVENLAEVMKEKIIVFDGVSGERLTCYPQFVFCLIMVVMCDVLGRFRNYYTGISTLISVWLGHVVMVFEQCLLVKGNRERAIDDTVVCISVQCYVLLRWDLVTKRCGLALFVLMLYIRQGRDFYYRFKGN